MTATPTYTLPTGGQSVKYWVIQVAQLIAASARWPSTHSRSREASFSVACLL
jgi:hypothetical protein